MTAFRVTKSTFLAGLTAAALLPGCAPDQDAPTPAAADVNVSRYLAVGDSYTAGVSNGGLTRTSQEYSFPNLLAQQFRTVAADAPFAQPLLDAGTGTGYLTLVDLPASGQPRVRRVAGQAVRSQVIDPNACGGADTTRLYNRSATAGTLPQNLGVPGLRLSQTETASLGNEANATPGTPFNPYFERLLPAADSRTYLQVVTAAAGPATFYTFFMGLDELMPYVRSGGTCPAPNSTQMRTRAKNMLDVLAANGRKGIIATLPSITSLPLVRLGKGLELQRRVQAQTSDSRPIYVTTNTGVQAITDAEYVLASAIPNIGRLDNVGGNMVAYGRDMQNPLRNADVLDSREISIINLAANSYNNQLDLWARDVYRMPILPDGKYTLTLETELFNQVANRISINGVIYTTEPVRGNFFSLDNYTLTPRGYGLLANTFIRTINTVYRANIPGVDVNSLPTSAQ